MSAELILKVVQNWMQLIITPLPCSGEEISFDILKPVSFYVRFL